MDDLAIEAMSLTDGADIHDVAGMVAIYRGMIRDAGRERIGTRIALLRVRKRMELSAIRGNLTCIASPKG